MILSLSIGEREIFKELIINVPQNMLHLQIYFSELSTHFDEFGSANLNNNQE